MKILKRFATIVMALAVFIPGSIVHAEQYVEASPSSNYDAIEQQAEDLYSKINDFLTENENVKPEDFDDVCREYMSTTLGSVKLIDEAEFEKQCQNGITLYRGVRNKQFADDLRNGIVYIPQNIRNFRGIGIYTTTSFECAKFYSDTNDPDTVVKMLIPKENIKILENESLEKIKEVIRRKHKEEFGEFTEENNQNYIFDNITDYWNAKYKEFMEMLEREKIEDTDEQDRLAHEFYEKSVKDPIYQEIIANYKCSWTNNKAAVFYNPGLLTKMLGFDVLHTIAHLGGNLVDYNEEYLIVNSEHLAVVK